MKTLKKLTHAFLANVKDTVKRAYSKRITRISLYAMPGLGGLAMVALGVALINLPAGVIVGGIALLWLDARI